jgi:aspartate-semialdehyde dehydrogenase
MRLGIIGISGLVGEKILESMKILNIKYSSLYIFASESSKGKIINFNNEDYVIDVFEYERMKEFDVLILAVENDIARNIIGYKRLHKLNTIIIDNSSEFRLDDDVPLIIPEINPEMIKNNQVIANPNCSTTMLVMLLAPLSTLAEIIKVNVSTYQAASGAGKKGLDELIQQTKEYVEGKELTTDFWKKQYVFNVFSHNSKMTQNLYNQEEMKMVNETHKILKGQYETKMIINPTCVRVPTLTSHCLSVNVEFSYDVEMYQIIEALRDFPGIVIEDDITNNSYPEPCKTSGKTDVYVGRIRPEIDADGMYNYKCYNFFVSGDQLLKGAAYNSVQILKYIMDNK